MKQLLLIATAIATAGAAFAQAPSVNTGGVVNVASYAYADLPSGGIAQGSIFGIFGNGLGPATLVQANTYPLPETLGGVTVKVTSGATSANAILFFVSAKQINALLPSSVATGNATLTVTYNGATSAAASFKVVSNNFGIFTLNSGGTGPGAITNPQGVPFGLNSAANPDESGTIWGTGLAGVQGNEANGALPGDMPGVAAEVYVGSTKATVTYRGRSGCCAGLDQIVFTVPNVVGCRVPVTVKIGNVVGNYASMAIAPKGTRTCSDTGGPSQSDLQKYSTQGAAVGVVALSRVSSSLTVPFLGTVTTSVDVGAGTFVKYTPAQLDASQNPFNVYTPGTCSVYYYRGSTAASTDPIVQVSLDAGTALSVAGAAGSKQLTRTTPVNGYSYYSGVLATSAPGAASTTFLDAGNFTVSGPGGTQVGGFSSQLAIPAALNWTNQAAITDVTRSAGQQITWSGGDPAGTVSISGSSGTGSGDASVGAGFTCTAKTSDGQFTIPAQVLLSLPVSTVVSGVPTGALIVGSTTPLKSFSASGIDVGYLVGTITSLKTLNFK